MTDTWTYEEPPSLRREFYLLTEEELATMLNLKVSTAESWRMAGKGPKFVKLGKGVFYRYADVREWIDQQSTVV